MLIVEPESYRRQRHVLELSRDKTLDVVCAVAGKREALSYLAQRPVDFIVTNSMLPDGSPADIIRAAHKRNPDCLVLAASECDDANIVMHTITSGANGYVLFPTRRPICALACVFCKREALRSVRLWPARFCARCKVGKISGIVCPKNIPSRLENSTS